MQLHLHHLKQSRSVRIIWLLEELGLTYQLTSHDRKNGLAPERLKAIHPLGKAPILQVKAKENTPEITLVESAVIIEYLIDYYDSNSNDLDSEALTDENIAISHESLTHMVTNKQFRPDYGTPEFEQYRYWLHFAESSLMPLLVMQLMLDTMIKKSPLPIKPISKMLKKGIDNSYLQHSLQSQLAWIDKHLANHDWFAGHRFSGADIQMAFGLDSRAKQGKIDEKYVNIHNWLKKCYARPAYQKAMQLA